MRRLGKTKFLFLAALLGVGLALVFGVGSALADFNVVVGKGCVSPVYVGDPYQCHSNLQNADTNGNTYVVQSLTDTVHSSGGNLTQDLFALHTPLVFVTHNGSAAVSCTNGTGTGTTGDPFIPTSTTTCTLPGDPTVNEKNGGEILVGDPNYSNYTVLPGDFTANAAHLLSDQITYGVTDSCDVAPSGCFPGLVNPENATGAAAVMQRKATASTTILAGANPVTTVAAGTTVHDSGSVTEDTANESPPPAGPGPVPTGNVTINFFSTGNCMGTVTDTGTATLDGSGNFNATAMPETPATAGMYSFQATYNGDSTYTASPASGCEPLQVVDANISLSPLSKTNAVGTSHTVTCTINQNTGSGFVAAPDGTECDWSITVGPNSGQSGHCNTTGGTCTFTYSDTGGAGTDTIHATTTFLVDGLSLTRSTGDGVSNDGSNVSKTWVDANISLSPGTANNPVGTSHTVTCTINQNTGSGFVAAPDGTECDWSITAGPNSGQSGHCNTTGGTCTFTYSDTGGAGTDTIHATTTFLVDGLSLTRSTGDGVSNDGSDAKKTWLDDTVTTKVLAGSTDVTGSTTITPGTVVHDEATVSTPVGAPAATGNVTFTLFNGTTCNGTVVSTDPSEPLNGSGVADSVTFTTPSAGGPFSYLAHYNGDANYPAKNAGCEPFTVQAQNFGPALTPGFWKNHQAATTALLPISLGNYNVNTFAKALAVFDAMKCSSPIDCLAGHLLAAELDLKGGSNPSIQPTINQANALLIAVNYNGPGNFTATAAQKSLALQLEVLIDNYTNQ